MQPGPRAVVIHSDAHVRRSLCDILFDVLAPSQLFCSAPAPDQPEHPGSGQLPCQLALVELNLLSAPDGTMVCAVQAEVLMALAQAPTHADWCAGRALGAHMVLDTQSPPAELGSLIRSALEGPNLRRTIPDEQAAARLAARANQPSKGLQTGLTSRQQEVLDRIREGHTNHMIAAELGISENTVRLHVSAILKTLNVRNRTAAALLPHLAEPGRP